MWDIYCFLSGINASGGVRAFYGRDSDAESVDAFANNLAAKLAGTSVSGQLPSQEELKSILVILIQYYRDLNSQESTIPKSYHSWCPEVVAIGILGEDDPGIELRICREYDSVGGFEQMLSDDGTWVQNNTKVSQAVTNQPATFMDRRCWAYLQTWLSVPLTPGREFYLDFWDVVEKSFDWTQPEALHGSLDYGLMSTTWSQAQAWIIGGECTDEQAFNLLCLDGAPNLSRGIIQGLRDKDLAPALLKDFQCWIWEQPDVWPTKPEAFKFDVPKPTTYSKDSHRFLILPSELILEITSGFTLCDLLTLASTSKAFRTFILSEPILPMVLRNLVGRGTLKWIKPCALVDGEVQNANRALATWVDPSKSLGDPLQNPGFPWFAFIRTCFVDSDSMKSRKRLWNITKQLEQLWIDFVSSRED
ncbi:hypothetical protein DL96DRAFT_22388 [Flagelloscypha sp. PMI_526]|nr:hypothetical protein DL96DRAFT_22388 [Flagelloscypha sp. PMI_526]